MLMSGPVKVLIVDDEQGIRDNFRDYLEDLGYEVCQAADGGEGLEVFAREEPDLVLTDLCMPQMRGADLVTRIRALSPATPIVVVSGSADMREAIESLRNGASDYVVKPVLEAVELDVVIRRNLESARLREENRRYQENLEELVRQRTQELRESEEQLHQSQKLEAVGQLAGGLAHDINNMLTAILGHADLLRLKLGPDGPLQIHVCEMEKAVTRSRGIIRQLLAFARKQQLEPHILDLNEQVAEIHKVLAPLIGEDIHLRFQPGTPMFKIRFDPSSLDQVIMNLVVNARDAMPRGGTLDIETSTFTLDEAAGVEGPPGPYVVLSVRDSGQGMDRETLARIFEPFYTTKPLGKGTGLGLSTVFGIIKQGGGFIRVTSALGAGSTFRVHIPAFLSRGVEEGGGVGPAARGDRETILVVEDDLILRDVLPMMLAPLGYEVRVASSPQEALAWCRDAERHFDLLLTDVVMPGMSGVDLVGLVGAARPDLKVLLMSGYTSDSVARRGGFKRGCHYIQKPFTSEELGRKVADALKRSRSEVPST